MIAYRSVVDVLAATADIVQTAVIAACATEEQVAAGWRVEPVDGGSGLWIEVRNLHAALPPQGWKLHVSAGVASAEDVLRRTLPVLLAEPCAFKVAASVRRLYELNLGACGPTQAGKFITVYPGDDDQAVRLAAALDEATRGLHGPAVPSDRPLRPGSLVHYRYGAIAGGYLQTASGDVLPALVAPDGSLVPDRRGTNYQAPAWAVDPFVADGVAVKRAQPNLVFGARYLAVALLHRSARNTVRLVVDTVTGERRVLKQARAAAGMELPGAAAARLRHEAEVLAALGSDARVPRVYDLVEHDGDLCLVLEDCTGPTLEQRVMELAAEGRFPPAEQIVAWGRELAGILATVHDRGFVYCDLKAANVILSPDGRLRLVDFETARRQNEPWGADDHGTPGYISPQRGAGVAPTVADDVYSLGALLCFLTTGAGPTHAPDALSLLDRPVELLNPAAGALLAPVIARCLDAAPAARFPSMAAVADALAATLRAPAPDPASPLPLMPPSARHHALGPDERRRYRGLAHRLADSLSRAATPCEAGPGLAWASSHPAAGGLRRRDLSCGGAGAVLALAELVAEFGEPEHGEVLRQGARWLAVAPPFAGAPLPGLYVGEAGIGAALLRAAQVLGDGELLAAATAKGRLVAALPHRSPDLFNGTAGRLRFHLFLWDETGREEHRRAAIAAGEFLLAAAETPSPGERCWRIPDGYDGASGQALLGYAHGAAGIADALLDLYEVTGDERVADAARGAGRWLARLAQPALDDDSGLDWPSVEGGRRLGATWCHGATGVGRFFLHAATARLLPEAAEVAARAARTVARGARWAGPTQCHGLAGNIEFLLDMARSTGNRVWLREASTLARLLEAFAAEKDGTLVFPSESPRVYTPDYMVGYAGIAIALLRLARPETVPHQLSRVGFRRAASVRAA
jgi:serine/threonine protein kinase